MSDRLLGALVVVVLGTGCTADNGGGDTATSTTGAAESAAATTGTSCEQPSIGSREPLEDFDQVVTIQMFCGDSGTDPDAATLVPVRRLVPADRDPVDATMLQLFIGETPEEAAEGLTSIGDPYSASAYIETTVEDGIATLHFRSSLPWENNITTTTAGAFWEHQVKANIFQFPEISGLEIRVDGSRWCGFENTCRGDAPFPYFVRSPGRPAAGAQDVDKQAAADFADAWSRSDAQAMRNLAPAKQVEIALDYGRAIGDLDCTQQRNGQYQCVVDVSSGTRMYMLIGEPGERPGRVWWVSEYVPGT